jgi:hypothetical protein
MIRNLVEDHARELYAEIRDRFPDFCGCETCAQDVLIYALNRLPPRYVGGREGTVVTDGEPGQGSEPGAIEVAIMEGIRKVTLAPRCERRRTKKA